LRAAAAALAFLALASGSRAATQLPGDPNGPYILVEAETGRVLDHNDALRPWFPASTTKLMTIYVVFRALAAGEVTMESPVTVSAHAAAEPPSKMGFKPGTELTLDDALKIMMVKSANDIAMALAESVGGSEPAFAARMNAEAARLGMTRSHWTNPNGLPDPSQYTTARDMAVLARALLTDFPQYRDYFRIPAIQFGKIVVKNYNPLLERYFGASGMKTGFICASGFNLVASARRGEKELIAVVYGEYGGKQRAEHAAALLDQGFQTVDPPNAPSITLATVSSGQAYTAPLDMRPFVCSGKRAVTAADAPEGEAQDADKEKDVVAAAAQPVTHLGPPIYLGPPVPVFAAMPRVVAVARVPKPRPSLAADGPQSDVAQAFAPTDSAGDSAPAAAIGSAAGAPKPLRRVKKH
jgi:D-alanyl-D-alanine carboxypeptidase